MIFFIEKTEISVRIVIVIRGSIVIAIIIIIIIVVVVVITASSRFITASPFKCFLWGFGALGIACVKGFVGRCCLAF